MNIINLNDFRKLAEAAKKRSGVGFLNAMIPQPLLDKATEVYGPMEKTYQGQLQVLEDAKAGKDLALYYLYKRYMGITVKIFNTFLWWSLDQDTQIAEEFATRALALLSGGKDLDSEGNITFTGPHKTWSPEAYPHLTKSSNYLNYFGVYYMNYLREEAKKLYRLAANKGGKGTTEELANANIPDDPENPIEDPTADKNPTIVSYDSYFTNDKDVATEDFSDSVDAKVTLEGFEDWLKDHKNKTYQDIFEGLKNGVPVNQIAEDLGIKNPQMVRNYADRLRKWALDFYQGN